MDARLRSPAVSIPAHSPFPSNPHEEDRTPSHECESSGKVLHEGNEVSQGQLPWSYIPTFVVLTLTPLRYRTHRLVEGMYSMAKSSGSEAHMHMSDELGRPA